MGVSLECYRAAIGLFNCRISVVSTVNFSSFFFEYYGGLPATFDGTCSFLYDMLRRGVKPWTLPKC